MNTRPRAHAFRFRRPVPYPLAQAAMERLVDARLAGTGPDTALFLEHEPVITLGNRGRDNFLLRSPEDLARAGIPVIRASRGGDVTYHGPGQLVVYPVFQLGAAEADARGWLFNLEEAAIRVCADFGIAAYRVPGQTGAWTDQGKIAAIGVRFRRWVAYHGMSFNVAVDLGYTRWIVPCGLVGKPVASLARILGNAAPPLSAVCERMRIRLAEVTGRRLAWTRETPGPLKTLAPYRA